MKPIFSSFNDCDKERTVIPPLKPNNTYLLSEYIYLPIRIVRPYARYILQGKSVPIGLKTGNRISKK